MVRDATVDDLPAIAAIYTHYVLKTTITFNTGVRTPREWRDRFEHRAQEGYLVLVAERAGGVVGFVETGPFRPHHAYRSSIEVSVYVAPDEVGGGIGTALYDALFTQLTPDTVHRVYAVIALPNPGSVAFHERYGFVHRGTLTEAGRKFGRFLDVAFYERAMPAPATRDTPGA